ncbi:MAG: acetate--CoA ligase family protein [Peptococcaceae bacterium]|nr:acetate--CoA ligase family protein [Peptococcaceae bacterium]
MARLLENDALRILVENKLPVPRFDYVDTPEEAKQVAENLNVPVVLKALAPVGKRGEPGALVFADEPEQAELNAKTLLSSSIEQYPVKKVLVREKVNTDQELYVSISIDQGLKCPVVMVSAAGGVDYQEIVLRNPEKIRSVHLNPYKGLPDFVAKEIWADLGLSGSVLRDATAILTRLYQVFCRYDCNMLEVNPLVITKDSKVRIISVDMVIDEAALFRHPELNHLVQMGHDSEYHRPLTALEKNIADVNEADPYRGAVMFMELSDGDIAFMCGGCGGSLLMLDTLLQYGGRPANFLALNGNPSERKVYGLAKVMLAQPGVKGLFVCAGIANDMQVDVVARGIARALQEEHKGCGFPVLVRLAGVNDQIGREIFTTAGVEYYGEEITMTMAAQKMADRMKQL